MKVDRAQIIGLITALHVRLEKDEERSLKDGKERPNGSQKSL